MQQTLFSLLTDEQARSSEAIEENLNQELIVGAPWFSRSITEAPEHQQIATQ